MVRVSHSSRSLPIDGATGFSFFEVSPVSCRLWFLILRGQPRFMPSPVSHSSRSTPHNSPLPYDIAPPLPRFPSRVGLLSVSGRLCDQKPREPGRGLDEARVLVPLLPATESPPRKAPRSYSAHTLPTGHPLRCDSAPPFNSSRATPKRSARPPPSTSLSRRLSCGGRRRHSLTFAKRCQKAFPPPQESLRKLHILADCASAQREDRIWGE